MTAAEDWPDLREQFKRLARREGITHVADRIPADRRTVYRLIDGDTLRPSRAVRAGIERLVNEQQEHQKP